MFRTTALASFALFGAGLSAQDMTFSGGTLTVLPGTTLTINGPLVWQMGMGAQVVNNGVIDLGTNCLLVEQPGAPFTGMGTEQAAYPLAAPIVGADIGGLGLSVSTMYTGGDLQVERGHQPQLAVTGVESIRRWYRISTPQVNSFDVSVELHYDLTELNTIDPDLLGLYVSQSLTGPWSGLASVSNVGAQTVAGSDQQPVDYFTAFDADAANSTGGLSENDGPRAWPSLFEDVIHLQPAADIPIAQVELLDAFGRIAWQPIVTASSTGVIMLQPPPLAPGNYVLRINGQWNIKLVRA